MPSGDVTWLGLAASLLLVGVAIALSVWRGLGLEREMVVATVRATVQLTAVGYALQVVIDPDQPVVYAWLWVAAMVPFAAYTVSRRAPEVPTAFSLALLSTAASTAVSLGVVFGFGIFPAEGRVIVPIGGMMIGNAMKDAVVASRRIVAELSEKRPEVEARLALGQPWQLASRPYLRTSLRTALISQIETTKAVGLVFLPGAMTGLILAGVDPVDAVKVQAAIMFLILGAVATNITVIGIGVTRRLFTSDHRLVRLERSAG
ncbi:MAG TPA: iron export ABC transporter permease subunit FetB [Acidimicrobiales bacterium]|nr:iron export ABC transporter permease subunit FetB [Acidimicrobiales bacterium]